MSETREVLEAAVMTITSTMEAGAATNPAGSFWNKDNIYHLNKALHHLLRAWHEQDPLAKEKDSPHLVHIDNAMTRLAMIRAKIKREQLISSGVVVDSREIELTE